VKLGLPIKKKYDGPARHPLKLVPPRPEVPFIDDGSYHGNLQDVLIGVNYLLVLSRCRSTLRSRLHSDPGLPHFAQAAVGRTYGRSKRAWKRRILLPFSYWYYRGGKLHLRRGNPGRQRQPLPPER
jgi:hypothetical protein